MGPPAGAVLGALALVAIETFWAVLFGGTYRDIAVFVIMIGLLTLRPGTMRGHGAVNMHGPPYTRRCGGALQHLQERSPLFVTVGLRHGAMAHAKLLNMDDTHWTKCFTPATPGNFQLFA